MRILRNYLVKECIAPFFIAISVLTCVFLLGNLIKLTDLVINKGVSLGSIGKVFMLYVPVLIGYTLPIACLISVILAMSRFSVDNEIIAIRASGIYLGRLIAPLFIGGIILSLVAFILNDRLIPYAHHEQKKLIKNLGATNPAAFLEEGMFIKSFDNQTLFIHKIRGNKMYNISIWQPQEGGPTRNIIAERGEFTPVPGKDQIILKLVEGTSDEPVGGDSSGFYKLNFNNYFMTLDLSKGKKVISKKPKSMTLDELAHEIEEQDRLLISSTTLRTEYHRKINWSFAPLMFILLGFPIAVITNKREKSANVVLAIMCAAGYYLLTLTAEGIASEGALAPEIAMCIPNIITFLIAAFFIKKCVS